MDKNTKTITVSNGEARLPKGKRDYLIYSDTNLIPCSMEESDDGYTLEFDLDLLTSVAERKDLGLDKFRLLSNCRKLTDLCSRYEFSLSPDNVYFDSNLIPKVLMRDYGEVSDEDFLKGYKALIASVLNEQYTFEDYYNGGEDLYKKDKTVNAVNSKETIDEIQSELMARYDEQKAKLDEEYVYINKAKEKRLRILFPIVCVLLVLSILGLSYLCFFKIPLDKKLISADNAFLNGDYIAVQTTLADVDVDQLPYMSKYILAVSYLKSVDLDQDSKQYELAQLTTKTEETRFDFWIHIGRLQYEEAIDDAQRLNSDRHLFYAYVGYKKYVENNLDLNGEEKENLLSELDGKIEALRNKLVELQAPAEEETAETEETVPEETTSEKTEPVETVPEETVAEEGSSEGSEAEGEDTEGSDSTDPTQEDSINE